MKRALFSLLVLGLVSTAHADVGGSVLDDTSSTQLTGLNTSAVGEIVTTQINKAYLPTAGQNSAPLPKSIQITMAKSILHSPDPFAVPTLVFVGKMEGRPFAATRKLTLEGTDKVGTEVSYRVRLDLINETSGYVSCGAQETKVVTMRASISSKGRTIPSSISFEGVSTQTDDTCHSEPKVIRVKYESAE